MDTEETYVCHWNWINKEDRAPEKGAHILVICKGCKRIHVPVFDYNEWRHSESCDGWDGGLKVDFDFWMPASRLLKK